MSVTKVSRGSGNQPVRIAPKPAATSTGYSLGTPVSASTGVMSAFDVQAMSLPILVAQTQSARPAVQKCGDSLVQRTLLPSPDVSSRLAVTAQNPSLASAVVSLSETTPSLQSSGNMVPQNQPPLAAVTPSISAISSSNNVVAQGQHPVPVVIQNSSTQAIHSSGKSQTQPSLAVPVPQTPPTQAMYGPGKILPQNQSPSVSAVPQTPSTQAMYSPGKILPQNQSPLISAVSQTPSTQAMYSLGKILPQNQSRLTAAIPQTPPTQAMYSPGKILPQNQSRLTATIPQTPPTQAMYSPGKILPQNQSRLTAVIPQTPPPQAMYSLGKILPQNQSRLTAAIPQTPPPQAMYSPGKILPQNQSQLTAAIPQIPSTLAINNTGNMVAQSQSPSLAAVSQTTSTLSIPGSSNMLPQNQSPLSGAVNQTSLTPTLQSFDDMPPQTGLQTPPPIIISDNASTQPDQSFLNMQSQNQLPMMTDFSRPFHNVGMPTHSQQSSTVVSQTAPDKVAPQSFLSTYRSYSGNFSMPSYPNSAHMLSQPCSASASSLDKSNRQSTLRILREHFPQSRPASPLQQVCSSAGSAQQFNYRGLYDPAQFGLPISDRSTQLPLNVLADATMLQEQTTNSTASSSHVQVQILSIFFVHD